MWQGPRPSPRGGLNGAFQGRPAASQGGQDVTKQPPVRRVPLGGALLPPSCPARLPPAAAHSVSRSELKQPFKAQNSPSPSHQAPPYTWLSSHKSRRNPKIAPPRPPTRQGAPGGPQARHPPQGPVGGPPHRRKRRGASKSHDEAPGRAHTGWAGRRQRQVSRENKGPHHEAFGEESDRDLCGSPHVGRAAATHVSAGPGHRPTQPPCQRPRRVTEAAGPAGAGCTAGRRGSGERVGFRSRPAGCPGMGRGYGGLGPPAGSGKGLTPVRA